MIPIEFLKNSTNVKDKARLEKNGLSKPLVHPYVGQLCKFLKKAKRKCFYEKESSLFHSKLPKIRHFFKKEF